MTTPLEPQWDAMRLRACEIGTANIKVSLLFGTASLVWVGLGLVMPWWAAGAVACTGLLFAELLVDRQETGQLWSLDHALDPVAAFEEREHTVSAADVRSARQAARTTHGDEESWSRENAKDDRRTIINRPGKGLRTEVAA